MFYLMKYFPVVFFCSLLVHHGVVCTRPTTVPPVPVTDCLDVYNAGNTNDGIYTIKPLAWPGPEFQVYCDMTTDGGGWTVFQRREGGSVAFYRHWDAYKLGFGFLGGEHWLGNDKLVTITNQKNYQLRVDIVDPAMTSYFALYNLFRVHDVNTKYRLSLGSYSGTAGDSLSKSNDKPFSTHDKDNDPSSTYNCAVKHRSGWWYQFDDYHDCSYCYTWSAGRSCRYCTESNLNGDYSGRKGQNVSWAHLPSNGCKIRQTEMKIRPIKRN